MKRYEEYKPTKYPWLPIVPSHWKTNSMRALTVVSSERRGNREAVLLSVYREYGVIVKSSRDDNHNVESEDLSNYKMVYKGDLVMNKMKMWQGSLGVSEFDGVVSPAYIVCHIIDENINRRYLHMLLRSPLFKTYYNQVSYGVRVGQWDMHYEDFKGMEVSLPPRAEQDQIVRYLDWQVSKINHLIAAKKKQIELYKELVNKAFASAISDKHVRIKRVCDLVFDAVDIVPETQYCKTGMYNRGRGIFRRDPMPGNELGDSKFQHISRGCVMISGQFAWEGAAYVTDKDDEAGIVSHRYYLLKPSRVSAEFLWAYLMSAKGLLDMQTCSHGSAGRNRPLNINELLNTYIPLPASNEEEQKVINAVRLLMKLNVQKDETILLYTEMRSRIISDVVTGQLDVRNVEIPDFEYSPNTDSAVDEDGDDEDISEEV